MHGASVTGYLNLAGLDSPPTDHLVLLLLHRHILILLVSPETIPVVIGLAASEPILITGFS
jgi:hypothetical protein